MVKDHTEAKSGFAGARVRDSGEWRRFWTISNFLSLSRVFLLAPILILLHKNTPAGNLAAVGVILVAAATDWFDGFLARKFHQQSEIGRIIDPLADKICVAAVALYLALARDFPLWFLVLILARDFVILLLGLIMTSGRHQVPESNWYGKVTVTAMAIVLVVFILDVEPVKWPFFWTMVVLFFISVGVYSARFATFARKP